MALVSLESNIDNDLYNDLKARYANRKVLVYAGAISNEKGVMNIVRAINNVRIQHRDVKLLLIGSAIGDDTEILNKYITQSNIKEYIDIIRYEKLTYVPLENDLKYVIPELKKVLKQNIPTEIINQWEQERETFSPKSIYYRGSRFNAPYKDNEFASQDIINMIIELNILETTYYYI